MRVTFTTTLELADGKNATGIRVPADAIVALGGTKRPPVVVSLAGYTYRSTGPRRGSRRTTRSR